MKTFKLSIGLLNEGVLYSPMDQFEIKPFFGGFWGLNHTPIG